MGKSMVILCFASWATFAASIENINDMQSFGNSSDADKDMYVINAMVYQVGVITNKTNNETANYNATSKQWTLHFKCKGATPLGAFTCNVTLAVRESRIILVREENRAFKGNQEAVTFYHTNGSQIDLSHIPPPLLTNVTAQSLVGVAPVLSVQSNVSNQLPLSALPGLTNIASSLNLDQGSKRSPSSDRIVRSADLQMRDNTKRYKNLFTRDTLKDTPVAISKGAAFIPQTADVQSIAIPPLLSFNNNLSQIPVPIPNTSIVHYTKINTLLNSP